MDKSQIGQPSPYGGVIADVSVFPVGTRFHVTNGCWNATIIEMPDGQKAIRIGDAYCGNQLVRESEHVCRLGPNGSQENLFAISELQYPKGYDGKRKTISLGGGHYIIRFDAAGLAPEDCFRDGQRWMDMRGNALYQILVAELLKARKDPNEGGWDIPPRSSERLEAMRVDPAATKTWWEG